MKTNFWMVLGTTISTTLLAQTSSELTARMALITTDSPPAVIEKEVNLVPGPATVAADNVNVRGQATMQSEVIARLNKGDTVTVLEKITLAKPKLGEPVAWARIAFPTNGHVWVHTLFVDPTNKTVLPKKLNLRAGPGENHSVVGVLERGEAVNELVTKGNWMEIAAPTTAYAFVAAQYLQQENIPAPTAATPAPAVATAAPTAAAAAPAEPAPATPTPAEPAPAPAIETSVPAQPTVAATAEPPQTNVEPGAATAPAVPVETPAPTPAPTVAEQPPPKRIVQREGIVRPTWSIQAPTPFALASLDTGETINYLYTTSTNLNLRRYRGLRIIVTGEEGLDARWTNTPVITIQRIHVIEPNDQRGF